MPAKRKTAGRDRIRRIGISTGGGDAPGLNAVIRAVAVCAHKQGWETVGIRDGYNGIFLEEQYPDGGLIPLTPERVRGITHLGGTIIGTTNSGNPLKFPVQAARRQRRRDRPLRRPGEGPRRGRHRRRGRGGRRRLAHDRERAREEGRAHRRRAQDDRQRPVAHGGHLRLRHRGLLRHRVHRPAALDRRVAPPRDGGRGDGPLRGLDRAQRRRLVERRRDPDPGDPLRHREGGREDPVALRERGRLRDRGGRRGRLAQRRAALGNREEGGAGGADRRRRRAHRRRSSPPQQAGTRASWCSATCCGAERLPPSTA